MLADEQSGEVERLRELLAEAEQHRAALEAELAEARRAQQQLQSYADDFRRTYAESRQRLQQMTALYEVSTTIGATVDPTEVVDRTAEGLRRLLPRDGTALYLLDEDGQLARRRAASCPAEITPPPEVVAPDQGPVGRCLRAGVPVLEGTGGGDGETGRNADGATSEAEASAGGGAVWSLALPLSAGQQQLGALLLLRSRDEPFADEERHLVEMVASQTAMALQNARLATTDALTGLYNRGYFDKTLAFECERARRVGRPLGLLIIDVDHFKAFNDEYGHPAGDEVLRLAAATLASQLRRTDIVARIGGEEFAAILPENDRDAAAVAAERLRRAVELRPRPRFEGQELPSLRISVGGASLPGDVVAPKRLMQAADEALQQAKRSGRNRSVIAEGPAAEVGS